MKKLFSKRTLITFVSLLLVLLSVISVIAATNIIDGDWKYEVANSQHSEYYIAGYLGKNTVLQIPSLYQTKPVTKVSREAFRENTAVTFVEIPKTINEIGINAFYCATALESITIPSSVTTIGINAFYGCTSLKTATFDGDTTLVSIPVNCFAGCSDLETVTIAQGTERILSKAFRGCSSLKNITIPASVTSIAADSFKDCGKFVIHGYNNSYAQQFAADNNFLFVSLGDYVVTEPTTTQVETSLVYPTTLPVDTTEATVVPTTTDATEAATVPATTDATEVTTIYTDPTDSTTEMVDGPDIYIIGDCDLDNRVTVKDATLIQKYAALLVGLDRIQLFLANCDSTGDVNVKDATAIQKYCAGFDNILFVGTEVEIYA